MIWCGYNTVEPDRPQMTVWCMRIACWVTKATNTHTQNMNMFFFYTVIMVA
jgi:hypothetical protein